MSNITKEQLIKKNEFYTQYQDVENELNNYKSQFNNKIIYCPCEFHYEESPIIMYERNKTTNKQIKFAIENEKSNFVKFLIKNAIDWNIKSIIVSGFNIITNKGIRFEDADFSVADIIVTNPPFSLFRDFVNKIMNGNKKFLIIGNNNAITYKSIFEYIRDNKIWLGYNSNKTFTFTVPDNYKSEIKDESGNKIVKVPAISWFTNLNVDYRNKKLNTDAKYTNEKYYKYYNFEGINVDRTNEIPMDYNGIMGVPITFLNKYNPEQFKIISCGAGELFENTPTARKLDQEFITNYFDNGGTGNYKHTHSVLGYYKNGIATIPYMRILIKAIP